MSHLYSDPDPTLALDRESCDSGSLSRSLLYEWYKLYVQYSVPFSLCLVLEAVDTYYLVEKKLSPDAAFTAATMAPFLGRSGVNSSNNATTHVISAATLTLRVWSLTSANRWSNKIQV